MDGVNFNILRRYSKPLVIGDDTFYSLHDWELTEKDLEKARRELGETEERKIECIRQLKSKLSKDAKINYRQDDDYLLRFLRIRKYDVSKAYGNIKTLYHLREKYKDSITTSSELNYLQNLNWFTLLPYTDEEGRILVYIKFKVWNPYETPFEKMAVTFMNVVDMGLLNPKSQINGIVAIYDLSGFSLKHFTEFLKKGRLWAYVTVIQNSFPYRLKECYLINVNPYFQYLWRLLKPLLRNKIADRVVLLGSDINELHQRVNPALLPMSLKGPLRDEDCNLSEYVLENLSYLRYERSFC